MTREKIISGLKFTVEMFLFNPSTGEYHTEPQNDMDRITIDACKGAIELLEQEHCEDAISRQAAIDAVRKNTFRLTFAEERSGEGHVAWSAKAVYSDVIEGALLELPSVTPQQKTGRWIPVSERLPEAFKFVNCTCHSLVDDREDWVIETVYIPQPSDSPYSDWGNIPMLNVGKCEVVAWMYRDIPEPYKAESEDKE